MLSTFLIVIHTFSCLILTTALLIRYCDHLHFTDGKIEALKSSMNCP